MHLVFVWSFPADLLIGFGFWQWICPSGSLLSLAYSWLQWEVWVGGALKTQPQLPHPAGNIYGELSKCQGFLSFSNARGGGGGLPAWVAGVVCLVVVMW